MARRWGREFQEDMPQVPPAPDTTTTQTPAPDVPKNAEAPQPAGNVGQQAQGVQDWDDPWERRARKVLGSEAVGSREDLSDPEHRKWINRKLRKARGERKKKQATKPATEEPEPETGGAEPAPTETGGAEPVPTGPQLPTSQGGAEQLGGAAGEQLAGLFPERRVPGGPGPGEPEMAGPEPAPVPEETREGRPEDTTMYGGVAGMVTGEGETLPLPTGGGGAAQQRGIEEPVMTAAGIAPPEYPAPPTGGTARQPSTPWPPPAVQPTFYTGGM